MPALDQCHPQVVRALEKEGWRVDNNPFILPLSQSRRLYIDIYAEKLFNGQGQTIVLVEVKCFQNPDNALSDLYMAVGQYAVYRTLLQQRGITLPLYLSVPQDVYHDFILPLIAPLIQEMGIKIVIVDIVQEIVVQWIE